MSDDPFRPLRLEYLEGARGRLPELRALAIGANQDESDRSALRRLAHNLRGSGGFYGFTAITEAAAALEELITSVGNSALPAPALAAATEALEQAILTAKLP